MASGPVRSLGKITTNAGSLVRFTANETTPADRYQCHAFLVEVLPTNTGKVYLFDSSTGSRTTLVGCIAVLAPPTTNIFPTFTAGFSGFANPIDASLYYIDVDVNGEGVLVSALVV